MSPKKIEDLVQKYLNGTSTVEERELLDSWYRSQLEDTHEWEADSLDELQLVKEKMFNVIKERITPNLSRKFIPNFYRYVAAAVIVVIATSTFFFYKSSQIISSDSTAIERVVISPGRNGAILTLGDGEKIILDNHALTLMDKAKMTGVYKYSDSLLEYKDLFHKDKKGVVSNTLTTPRGNKFMLVLSDGTRVFMNAGSTLQYPEIFNGPERIVKLTGEAYFEVAHNKKSPFKVQVGDQIVEDIGTSFNISAYEDESFISVTLVEGSVKIEKNKNQVVISPGQNALTSESNNAISVKSADLESDLAWRSDLFHFENVQLSEVLKQIARWYNLEIEYKGSIPTKTINGEIYRNVNGAQILTILKNLGVNFKLDGNKLIIENKQ
jgi:transmembrane sensor